MAKIPKNLSDKSMVGNYKEEITFENDIFTEDVVKPRPMAAKKRKTSICK